MGKLGGLGIDSTQTRIILESSVGCTCRIFETRLNMARWLGWSRQEPPGPVIIRVGKTPDPERYANSDLRRTVYDRDKGQCQYCGRDVSYEDCNMDHIWPWKRNGVTAPHNLVVCCQECNKAKGNQRIGLDAKPYQPRPSFPGRVTPARPQGLDLTIRRPNRPNPPPRLNYYCFSCSIPIPTPLNVNRRLYCRTCREPS